MSVRHAVTRTAAAVAALRLAGAFGFLLRPAGRRMRKHEVLFPNTDPWHRNKQEYFSSSTSLPFQPADPPGTRGTPVFPNIDFSVASRSTDATRRNSDTKSVFVVTGASRGIGLQFVKSLLHRTSVRTLRCSLVCSTPFQYLWLN